MNTLAEFLVDPPFVYAVLLKATVLLAAAWLAHAVLRPYNARWRVLLWRATLAGLAALPLAGLALPTLEIALHQEAPASAQTPSPAIQQTPLPTTDIHRAQRPVLPVAIEEASKVQAPASSVGWSFNHVMPLTLGLWALVVLLGAVQLARGWVRVHAALRRSMPAPDAVIECAGELRRRMGIRQEVQLRVLPGLGSPFLTGYWKPTIVVPERTTDSLNVSRLRAVIAHELAHVKTHDTFWIAFARLMTALLWFHPFLWRVLEAHGTACEEVCDAVAADLVGGAEPYSAVLAKEALAVLAEGVAPGGVPMLGSAEIMHRLRRLRQGIRANALSRRWVTGILASGAVLLGILGSLRLVQAAPDDNAVTNRSAAVAEVEESEAAYFERQPSLVIDVAREKSVSVFSGVEVELVGIVGVEPTLISADGRKVEPGEWGASAEKAVRETWEFLSNQLHSTGISGTHVGFLFRVHLIAPALDGYRIDSARVDLTHLTRSGEVNVADIENAPDRYQVQIFVTDLALELPDHVSLHSEIYGGQPAATHQVQWKNIPLVANANARFHRPRYSAADIIAISYQVDGEPWWPRFQEVYAPRDGAAVRLIKRPRDPVAHDYVVKSRGRKSAPDVIELKWDRYLDGWPGEPVAREKDVLANESFTFNGDEGFPLRQLPLALMELTPADIEVADSVPDTIIKGDWSIVVDAPLDERMKALETVLSEEAGILIHFESPETNQLVVVARGDFSFQPIPNPPLRNAIYIYGDEIGAKEDMYNSSPILEDIFGTFSTRTHVPIVNEANQPDVSRYGYEGVHFMPSAKMERGEAATPEGRRMLEVILDNLAAQTGLDFTIETRSRRVWRMTVGTDAADFASDNAGKSAATSPSAVATEATTFTRNEQPPDTDADAPTAQDLANETRTLRFRVVDENDSPLQGLSFVVYGQVRKDILRRGATDAEGRYTWKTAPVEAMEISISHPTGARKHEVLPLQEAENIIVFETPQLATIRGAVVDAETGNAVPDYEIWIGTNRDGSPTISPFSGTHWDIDKSSERNGDAFELKRPKQSQETTQFRVAIVSDGYFVELSPLFPQDNPPDDLAFKLEKAAPVEGRILDAAGAPVRGARVHLASEDFGVSMMGLGNAVSRYNDGTPDKRENAQHTWGGKNHVVVSTPPDGRFKLPALRPPYALIALNDTGFVRKDVTDPKPNHELRLEPCATLTINNAFHERVTYLGISNTPEVPAWFYFIPTHIPDMQSPTVVMENLPPGRYVVYPSYRAPGAEAGPTRANWVRHYVTLAPGEDREFTTLKNGPEVSGALSLPKGMTADVELRNDNLSISSSAITDGILRFSAVPPGQYQLVARLYAADTPDDVRRAYTDYEYPDLVIIEDGSLEAVDLGKLRTTDAQKLELFDGP